MPPILFPYEAHVYLAELICPEVLAHIGFYPWFEFGFDPGRYRSGSNLDRTNDLKDQRCRGRANLPLIS